MASNTITKKDWKTISLALNYALQEREGFAAAVANSCHDKVFHERAVSQMESFEKLHQKLFGVPTAHKSLADEDRKCPIHLYF